MYIFLVVSFAILPSVTTIIFQMFPCENIDPNNQDSMSDYYLIADYSIDCSSERYKFGTTFASFMIIVYPIGIPVLYFIQLYRRRDEIMQSDNDRAGPSSDLVVYKFLFQHYKSRFWYFELVETARRLLLTAVLSVTLPGSNMQLAAAIFTICCFTILLKLLRPFKGSLGDLVEMSQTQIFITFQVTLIVKNSLLGEKANPILGGLLIAVNLASIVISLLQDTHSEKNKNKSQDGTEADASNIPTISRHTENKN